MLGVDACSQTHIYTPNTEPEGALSALHLPETIQQMGEGGMEGGEKGRRKS